MEKMLINGTEKRYTEKRMYAATQAMRFYRRALIANCGRTEYRYPVTWIDKKEFIGPVEFLNK